MSKYFIHKAALLFSHKTPCYRAAEPAIGTIKGRTKNDDKKGQEAVYFTLYGVTPTAMNDWLKNGGMRPKTKTKLIENFNAARTKYPAIKEVTDDLDLSDFDDSVEVFDFAKKLGYERGLSFDKEQFDWYEAQRHINAVEYQKGALGKELSFDNENNAVMVANWFIQPPIYTGACLLYFMSITANRRLPAICRATLRIQKEVEVQGHFYIPCKLKMIVPSFVDEGKPRTYIGHVTKRGEYLYFILTDSQKEVDFIQFMIKVGLIFEQPKFEGIYTSINARQRPYSSTACLHRFKFTKESQNENGWRSTIDFMNGKNGEIGVFKDFDELTLELETAEFKNYLKKQFTHSPWRPIKGVVKKEAQKETIPA